MSASSGEFTSMNPNSGNQRWSKWVFGVRADPRKLPDVTEVAQNAQRFFVKGFRSTCGRVRCDQRGTYFSVVVEIEGPPAHDPEYVESVKRAFVEKFVRLGFGPSARLQTFEVALLAGSAENGTPPAQLIVLPTIHLQPPMGDSDGQRAL